MNSIAEKSNRMDSFENLQFQVRGVTSESMVIDALCGKDASECDAKQMYTNLGDVIKNEKHVPFQINYVTTPLDLYTLYNKTTVPCYKAVNVCLHSLFSNSVEFLI